MTDISGKHLEEYGVSPDFTVRVPGVSRFLGPFADYSRGCSLCAADSRNLYFCVSPRSDSRIRVLNSFANDRKHFSLSSLKFRREDRWANYIKGVIQQLVMEKYNIPGLDITIGGNLLGGSNDIICCSLVAATCLSMQELLGIKLDYSVLTRMIVTASVNFCGQMYCNSVVRTMLCSGEDLFIYFDNNKGNYRTVENPFKGNLALLYLESGVHFTVIKDEIDRKYEEMKNVVEVRYPDMSIPVLANLSEHQINERTFNMVEDERRVVRYLVDEYRNAILSDFSDVSLARAMGKNGKALGNILEFSFPELDWILKRANETPLCLGSTIVATGGNGTVAAAMDRSSVDSFAAKLEDYERIFGFKVCVSEFRPCRQAVVFRNSDESTTDK